MKGFVMNWEELEELDEEEYEAAMAKLKPEDFYFQLEEDIDNDTVIGHYFSVTPKSYFDSTGYLLDNWFPEHMFPPGFGQLCDSTYEYDGDPQVGRQLLLQAGFIEKKMF